MKCFPERGKARDRFKLYIVCKNSSLTGGKKTEDLFKIKHYSGFSQINIVFTLRIDFANKYFHFIFS